MFKNYLKVAWRSVLRQKSYAFINVAGLSIGLACSFFILLWVTHETSYDRFHEDGDQIYRVGHHFNTGGADLHHEFPAQAGGGDHGSRIPGSR